MTSTSLPIRTIRLPGRAVVARVLSRPDLLIGAVAAMGLVYVWRLPVLFPGLLTPLRLGIVTTAIALLAWFDVSDPLRRWARLKELLPVMLVLGLCVVALAAVPLGIYPSRALRYFRITYTSVVLYFLLTIASVRGRADLERLMSMHLVGAVIFSLFATWKSFGSGGRLSGVRAYDPNDFALLLVCTIPLAVYFMRPGVKLLTRVLAGLALVFFVVTLVRTGSRGGFLGFIAVMVYLLFRFKGLSLRVRMGALTIALLTLGLAGSDRYWALIGTIRNPDEDYNFTEQGGRVAVWKRGIGYMLDRPIAGAGLGTFGVIEGQSTLNRARAREGKGWVAVAAHNSFVQVGAELGVTGLLLFLGLIVVSFRACSWRAPPRATAEQKTEQALARSLAGALVGYCVAGFFLSQAYSAYAYSILGMIAALMKLRKVTQAPAAATAPVVQHLPHRRSPRAHIARRRG